MRDNKIASIIFGLIFLVIAVLLRVYQLGESSLWHDEAFTWFFTSLPWMEMLDTVRLDGVNPPVYYLGTKIFVDLFGDGEVVLRLLSLIAGSSAIYFAWHLGKQAGGIVGAWASAWFIAFHPMAIHYTRDARPYALVLALATLLVYVFIRLRKESSRGLWLSAFVLLMLGQLSHYFFFVLGGVILMMVLTEIREKPLHFRYWTLVWIVAFLPLAGWLAWYFSQPTPTLGIGWIQQPELGDVFATWWNLLSGYGGIYSTPAMMFGLATFGMLSISVLLAKNRSESLRFLIVGLVFPVIMVWLVSQRRPVFVDRYFIVFLPVVAYLFALGAAEALRRLRVLYQQTFINRWLWMGVPLILISLGAFSGWQVHLDAKYGREDWRGLVSYLVKNGGEDAELWLSEPEASIPIQYYLRGDLSSASTGKEALLCETPCWWVLRQPYTATHAFSQAVSIPGRPSFPELPEECELLDSWKSSSGIALWQVVCEDGSDN